MQEKSNEGRRRCTSNMGHNVLKTPWCLGMAYKNSMLKSERSLATRQSDVKRPDRAQSERMKSAHCFLEIHQIKKVRHRVMSSACKVSRVVG